MSEISKIGLGGEVDFLRRYNNRVLNRQKKIKIIKLKGFHLFFIFILFIITGFTAYKAGEFMLTWEKLDVKSFKLINSPVFESALMEKVLKRYNGNIMSLKLRNLRSELLTIKEVKEVSLSRKLPSTVEIKFELRDPVFQVLINKKYNLIDNEGVVLFKSLKKRNDLITIKNLSENELLKIIPHLSEIGTLKNSIEYVSFKKPYGVTLKLKGIKEIFYPGEKNFSNKINYYLKLRNLSLLNKDKIKNVDLRFKKRIYLEYEEEVNK